MKKFLIALSFIFFISPAVAAELSNLDIAHLNQYRAGIEALVDSADAGVITASQAEQGTKRYLGLAKEVDAKYGSRVELLSFTGPNTKIVKTELTSLQKFAGWITFTNILYIFGTVIGVLSVMYLCWDFITAFLRIFVEIPLIVYEVLLYASSAGMMGAGLVYSLPVMGPYIAFTGCLFLAGAIVLSAKLRNVEPSEFRFFTILFVVFAPMAILHDSSWIGFLSVGALMGMLGFSMAVTPLCYAVGFKDEDSIGTATAAAFYILLAFVLYRIFLPTAPYVHVFESGALFLGSFVGYLGLLIMASKWYKESTYALMQVVIIVAGVGALFIGSVFDIGELQKIGGTFFTLYLIEKVLEIPVRSARGYAVLGLMISGTIYGIFTVTKMYPEQIAPYLFFAG